MSDSGYRILAVDGSGYSNRRLVVGRRDYHSADHGLPDPEWIGKAEKKLMSEIDSTSGELSPTSTAIAPVANPSASSHAFLAKVTWFDTVGSSAWDSAPEINTCEVLQWGFVVFQDADQIKLADTYMEGEWFGVTAIPAGCIVSIQKIGD
jgi:hypothetical protein